MDIEHVEEDKYNLELSKKEFALLITGLKNYLQIMEEGNPEYFEEKIAKCKDMINIVDELLPE